MPISPYVPRVKEVARPILEVVDGERPPALNVMPYVVKLPLARIPKPLQDLLDSDEPASLRAKVQDVRYRFLPTILQAGTYTNHFRNLVWTEEHQMKCAIFPLVFFTWLMDAILVATWIPITSTTLHWTPKNLLGFSSEAFFQCRILLTVFR